jgi:hypothetical protein
LATHTPKEAAGALSISSECIAEEQGQVILERQRCRCWQLDPMCRHRFACLHRTLLAVSLMLAGRAKRL